MPLPHLRVLEPLTTSQLKDLVSDYLLSEFDRIATEGLDAHLEVDRLLRDCITWASASTLFSEEADASALPRFFSVAHSLSLGWKFAAFTHSLSDSPGFHVDSTSVDEFLTSVFPAEWGEWKLANHPT